MNGRVPDIRPDRDKPNCDPEKIAPCTLEDPLTFLGGRRAPGGRGIGTVR